MIDASIVQKIAGIHSKQPWFVLHAEHFFTHLKTENPVVSHYYSFQSGHSEEPTIAVPDGCIDLLFDCDATTEIAQVCGTTLEARSTKFNENHRYFGIRFVPGSIPSFIDTTASEMIDKQCNLIDVVKNADRLIDRVVNAQSFTEQVLIVKEFIGQKAARKSSSLTSQVVAKICQHKGNIQIQELEKFTGYSARTLQRRFRADIGLTPKGFSRAIRCQSAIYDINHSRHHVAFSNLACDLGFTDQSHFLKEFKKLVSTTPLEYQTRVKQKTYLERISCL
ncbi:helix-turn-helix domain-containing protein [Celerinatantimonas sp. MCCC 1A17872]|uniref:helix-turn-helix domain-containing protein n=1 Tax=Celerinatantimonas sp. MCCC 1A17872 TaxID=3177514 RepID=UPI0038C12B03